MPVTFVEMCLLLAFLAVLIGIVLIEIGELKRHHMAMNAGLLIIVEYLEKKEREVEEEKK